MADIDTLESGIAGGRPTIQTGASPKSEHCLTTSSNPTRKFYQNPHTP